MTKRVVQLLLPALRMEGEIVDESSQGITIKVPGMIPALLDGYGKRVGATIVAILPEEGVNLVRVRVDE